MRIVADEKKFNTKLCIPKVGSIGKPPLSIYLLIHATQRLSHLTPLTTQYLRRDLLREHIWVEKKGSFGQQKSKDHEDMY